jgi:DNA-binding transcriptional LysR family regulator
MRAIDAVDGESGRRSGSLLRPMKLSAIDTNLLVALEALLTERNVTRAAARLGVGQPAMSHSLARLREHFKDPLLIAKGRQLVLSEKASKLVRAVASATTAVSQVFDDSPRFDPDADRVFVLAAADLFASRVIPHLLGMLASAAPGAELEVRPLIARSTEQILSDGVELALGVFEDVPPSINQQVLFREPYVCVVRADHPARGRKMKRDVFLALPHLEVAPAPQTRPGQRIDSLLSARGERRRVTTRVPHFSVAARILASTDQVLTMTRGFAALLAETAPLRFLDCPLDLPPAAFSQIWSRRHDGDPGHRWLREAVAAICSSRAR